MNTNLSVIIVSFNTKDLLRDCIKSVYEDIRNLSYEIIVVDNASKDGSPDMIEEEFKGVKLKKNTQNMGFAKGNNQGMKMASGEYLFLLNSDTILKDGAVETLVKFMDQHPRAAGVGPKVLNFDGTLQSQGFCFPSVLLSLIILFRIPKFLSQEKLMKWFSKYYWDTDEVRRVDWISGCCILIRKSAMDKMGSLSEDFFMYNEDEEWCFRAKKSNYEVWYVPTAEVTHLNQSSPLPNRYDLGRVSTKLFYKKTGLLRGIVICVIYILSNLIKLSRIALLPSENNEWKTTRDKIITDLKLLRLLMR